MKLPRLKLKLIHSGLILVSVPLIFGLVSVVALNASLQNIMQMRKQMERSALAMAAVNNFVIDVVEARSDLIEVEHFKDSAALQRLDKISTQAGDDLNSLKLLAAKHAQYQQILSEIIPAAERSLDLLLSARKLRINAQLHLDRESELDSCIATLRTWSRDQAQRLPMDSVRAKQYGQSVQQFLAWMLAINIAACPLLVLYFSQSVIRRLSVLVANTERLAKQQDLLTPIEGDDEIAQLDKVFRTMAEKLNKARFEREEIERLKQDFIAMVSHDLRTPLNAVQGTLTLIADGVYGALSESGVRKAKVAEESIGRLANLANELLDLERLESKKLPIELKPTRLQQAISKSIDSIHGFAEYKQITIRSADTDAVVLADEERLIQVIVNLLSNAIKFSNDGGSVDVTVKDQHEEIEVRITDQGRGVPAPLQDAIFDRFRQVERVDTDNERGMGLGLAICKAIIVDHNGSIGCDSESGKGCSFWFRLKSAGDHSSVLPSISVKSI